MSTFNVTQYLMFQLQRITLAAASLGAEQWKQQAVAGGGEFAAAFPHQPSIRDRNRSSISTDSQHPLQSLGVYYDWERSRALFGAEPTNMSTTTTVTSLLLTMSTNYSTPIRNGTYVFTEMNRTLAELIMGTITFLVITVMTCVGNSLVVLSVFTYRPLKKVQNYFIVSLAVADGMVAILVMPFHLVKFLMRGRWLFGLALCQMWLTFDILCCTASILNLTAIALDRFWAIHTPMEYANKRTFGLVMSMITTVWVLSALISIPPLIGWNDWSQRELLDECELTSDKSFVVFSASGSFFIPLMVMSVVYVSIFFAARKRIHKNRDRSALTAVKKTGLAGNPGGGGGTGMPPTGTATTTTTVVGGATGTTAAGANHHNNTSVGNESSPLIRANSHAVEQDRPSEQSRGSGDNRRQSQSKKSSCAVGPPPTGTGLQREPNAVLTVTKQREKISVSKEKKAAKTLAVIMGVFVLCWLPFFLMYVIMPFCDRACYLHPKVAEAITWLGYINSAINPVIYTIFNMDFRRAFEKLICPTRSRDRRN